MASVVFISLLLHCYQVYYTISFIFSYTCFSKQAGVNPHYNIIVSFQKVAIVFFHVKSTPLSNLFYDVSQSIAQRILSTSLGDEKTIRNILLVSPKPINKMWGYVIEINLGVVSIIDKPYFFSKFIYLPRIFGLGTVLPQNLGN